MNLSAIITTKNEAENIGRCIKSLGFVDEVIVVDDHSTDETVSIATKLGARVITQAWQGYGGQKNIGIAQAQNPWVLCIDADEEVPPQLAAEIQAELAHPTHDVYWVPVLDFFLGKPLQHLTGNNPRLFKKDKAKWTDREVHEQILLLESNATVTLGDNNSKRLQHFLHHHSHTTVASYLKKMHRYTTLDARQMVQTSQHRSGRDINPSSLLPLKLALRQWVKLMFWRRGILDGIPGLVWAALSAYYEWEMAMKYLKMKSVK